MHIIKKLKYIPLTLFYFIICTFLIVSESLKYIIKGNNIIGKIAIIGGYVCFPLFVLLKPTLFYIALTVFIVCVFLISIYITWSTENDDSYESSNQAKSFFQDKSSLFFDGMSFDDAKKEYRKLMKKYHPDNKNGDAEMAKKVSVEYKRYFAVYGK